MLKTLVLFFALSPLFAAEKPPEVSFTAQSKVGNLTLEPGVYQVKLQGSIVFFTDSAGKSYSTVARIQRLPQKAAGTALLGETAGGRYQVISIVLTGTDFRLTF